MFGYVQTVIPLYISSVSNSIMEVAMCSSDRYKNTLLIRTQGVTNTQTQRQKENV